MSGTDMPYVLLSAYASAMACPVLTKRMTPMRAAYAGHIRDSQERKRRMLPIILRMPYAMSGTEVGRFRTERGAESGFSSPQVSGSRAVCGTCSLQSKRMVLWGMRYSAVLCVRYSGRRVWY
eukprot:2152346-Rhodomonas_salina.1